MSETEVPHARTLSIADAAAATGATVKSLRGRCDRGSLRYVVRDGKRMILTDDLIAAGLLDPDGSPAGQKNHGSTGQGQPRGTSQGSTGVLLDPVALLDRIAGQAEEIGRLRALTESSEVVVGQERAEADRLRAEVIELRVKLAAADAAAAQWEHDDGERRRHRPWSLFRRSPAPA